MKNPLAVCLLLSVAAMSATEVRPAAKPALTHYERLPLGFELNQGQTDTAVKFLSRGSGYTIYLTPAEAVMALRGTPRVIRMTLVGADPAASVLGVDRLPGKSNYFIGSDPAKWRRGIPTYARVESRGVYRGVDVVYYGNQRQLEYDFVVAPGADSKAIVLAFTGIDGLAIDANGDLVLDAGAAIRMRKPIVYQENRGRRKTVSGRYVLKGNNQVGFAVGRYDRTKPLVIDPVLTYSTYLGGSGIDQPFGVAVDSSGQAYVTGETTSLDFPTTAGAPDATFNGYTDAFVTKLNADGSALAYSTYLGGATGGDMGLAIAVDALGSAYVAGHTDSADFPTTAAALDASFNGGGFDGFVTKLDATGSLLAYSTYLGGNAFDAGNAIALDTAGNAYIAGQTSSTNFPTTGGAFQPALGGAGDAFVTKLDAAGSAVVYSTYVGGSGYENGLGVALDPGGNAYLAGYTQSSDLPTTAGAFDTSFNGPFNGSDGFVTRLDASGSAAVYSTYIGGSDTDFVWDLAVDSSGNAYAVGSTFSTDFPTTPGAFDATLDGFLDAFVTKVDPSGSAVAYSTFLGGTADESANGIAVDASGQAHVIGDTTSVDFPTTSGAIQPAHGGGFFDAFVTTLNAGGSAPVHSTYLGGTDQEEGIAVAVSADDIVYVTGWTDSADFPTTAGVFDSTLAGRDGYVARIGAGLIGPPTDRNQCKDGGWRRFNSPVFRNQGQCVSFVQRR